MHLFAERCGVIASSSPTMICTGHRMVTAPASNRAGPRAVNAPASIPPNFP
jgi:hypothetical protein